MPNKNGDLYNDHQRHFVLGGVFVKDEKDEDDLLKKYQAFKCQFGFTDEIKGTDLLKRENNRALEIFLSNMLDDTHFFICNYDKIFYLSTLISLYILGREFQEKTPLTFYQYASALSGEKAELFSRYCNDVKYNTEASKKDFLEYLCAFPFEQLDRNQNNPFIMIANKMLSNSWYGDFPLVYEAYSCKNTVHFINMTALGELLLCLKEQHGLSVDQIKIFHDNLEGYEDEYNRSFINSKICIEFVNSKNFELIQLADNICSIYRKCYEKSFEAFRSNSQWEKNIWFSENYSKFIHAINISHIKMVTQIADWALAYAIRDIFGTEKGTYITKKAMFWDAFFYYKELICSEISKMDVKKSL